MRQRRDGEKRELPYSLRLAIGNELSKIRDDLGLRLEDVADSCKTDPANIHRIEKAKQNVSLPMLHAMSAALGKTMWQILQVAEGSAPAAQNRLPPKERDIIVAVREKNPEAAFAAVHRALSDDGNVVLVDTDEPSPKHFGESSRGRGRTVRKEKGKPKR